jgi:PAS domain S-box-containing protein
MQNSIDKNARNFIKSVIDVAHVEFSSYDLKNNALAYTSGWASQLLGYTTDELKEFSKDYNRKIIHPDDLDLVNKNIQDLENSSPGQIVEMIVRYRRKNGQYIWGYTRKMVTDRDEDGKPLKMTIVAEDISELVSLQDELSMRVEQLEKLSHRNHHELRGPVASILGLANMMQEDSVISEYNRDIIQHLCRTVSKLERVVSEMSQDSEELDDSPEEHD